MGNSKELIVNSIISEIEFLNEFIRRTIEDKQISETIMRGLSKIKNDSYDLAKIPRTANEKSLLSFREFRLNTISRELETVDEVYKLTEKEFDILYPLCQKPNCVVDIGKRSSSTNTHLSNLKKKIPVLRTSLQSRHGQGLYLNVTPNQEM